MPTPDNVTEDDPEVSKTRALWVDRLWEAEQRYYGDVAVDSRSLWETARTSNDPREFTSLVYSVAQRIAESMVAGSPEGQPADAPPNRPTNALAGSEAPLAPVSADLRELDSTGRLEEAFRRGYARLTR
jgi:hypothetical protein